MRTEVMYGQYLDLVTTGRPTENTARALETSAIKPRNTPSNAPFT